MSKPIIINNFHEGVAPSLYLGFGEMRGLDAKNKHGIVYPDLSLVKESGSIVEELIEGTVADDNNHLYGYVEYEGNYIYKRSNSGIWSKITGLGGVSIGGIVFWKGYLITIDLDGELNASGDGGATWTNGFALMSNKSNKRVVPIVGQDDVLYVGTLNVIDKIVENDGKTFDPTDNTTWTVTKEKLDLPINYDIRSIVELGNNLMIGTINNADPSKADIFPWDRVSVSFDMPIRLKENGISYMIEVGNLLYIMGGNKGRWYISNGSAVDFLAEIPKTLLDTTTFELDTSFNSAVSYLDGIIYFGISQDEAKEQLGVYSLNVKTREIKLAHVISTGEVGENEGISIGSITTVRDYSGSWKDLLCVTWKDHDGSTSHGVDGQDTTRYTGDKAYLTSKFYRVGTRLNPHTFKSIDIELARPIVSGDSIKIYYRTENNGSWKEISTWSVVGDQSLHAIFVKTVNDVQFKIILNNTIELSEVLVT